MKERKLNFQAGVLFGFAIATALLFGTIIFWEKLYPLPYRVTQPVTQPSSSPADLGELTARVENLENDQTFNLKALEWKIDQKLLIISWVALFISSTAGFIGVKTYNDLDKVVKEKVNTALEKALYQLDPTNLPIHIYQGRVRREIKEDEKPYSAARESLPDVKKRLALTGLHNIGEINYLSTVSQTGITVVPIDDEEDENEFINIVKNGKIKYAPEETGFILYAPQGAKPYHVKKAQYEFPNTVIATMPATVASMVLVVGRGLKNRED